MKSEKEADTTDSSNWTSLVKNAPHRLVCDCESALAAVEALLWIRDKSGQMTQLVPNTSQRRLFDAIYSQKDAGKPVRLIVWKGRQQGLSTGVAAYNFLNMMANPRSTLVITEEKGGSAQNLWDMYLRFDEHFPLELGFEFTRLGHHRRYLNGSTIRVEGEKKVSSFTHQQIHLSEAPFFSRLSATLEMVLQTVPDHAGTAVFMESAANEFGMQSQEDWQNEWIRAQEGKSDFVPLFIPWYVHEEYQLPLSENDAREIERTLGMSENDLYGDERGLLERYGVSLGNLAWRRQTIRNKCSGNTHTFQRQYPDEPEQVMRATGLHVFDLNALRTYQPQPPKHIGYFVDSFSGPQFKERHDGLIRIWEPPEPGVEYVAGSDHAEGLPSGDFNCGYILRRLPLRVVARLRGEDGNRLSPSVFAEMMYHLLCYYGKPDYNPESNLDGGVVVALMLEKYHYPFLCNEGMFNWVDSQSPQAQRNGWRNTARTRQLVLNRFVELVDNGQIEIPDERLLSECRTFIRNHGKPEAVKKGQARKPGDPESGYYDDCVFAAASATWADKHLPPAKPVPQEATLPYLLAERIREAKRQSRQGREVSHLDLI